MYYGPVGLTRASAGYLDKSEAFMANATEVNIWTVIKQ